MEPTMTIRECMARDLVLLRPEMDLHAAMRLFVDHNVSGAPVVDAHGSLLGVLSDKDCFRAAVHASYHAEPWGPVSSHMSSPAETLDADTALVEAVEIFYRRPYRRYPVVSGGRLIGMLTRRDVMRALDALARRRA